MKSIIQEASSIAKAVEEGWIKAQKPQQFSVKILEEAERNFLGLTKKSAKVAIFFDEPQLVKPSEQRTGSQHHKQSSYTTQQRNQPQQPQRSSYTKPEGTRPSAPQQSPIRSTPLSSTHNHTTENTHHVPAQAKKQFEPLWNQAMIDRTHTWLQEALKNSAHEQVTFTVEAQKFHLRITLSSPILSDADKEKQLLASFSALILETLKRTFKMSLRGHKIVLTHKR